MKRIAFAVPGDLATPTGGYAYDRRIISELRGLGWQVDVLSLGEGFPQASVEQRAVALPRLLALPERQPVVVDGLALGALPQEAEKVAQRAPLVALVHHPLALETGLSRACAEKLFDSERRALAFARAVIVTSPSTAKQLSRDYGVPAERIAVAPPGTDRPAGTKGVQHEMRPPSVSPRSLSWGRASRGPGRGSIPPPHAGEENTHAAGFPPPFTGEVAQRARGGMAGATTPCMVRLLSVGSVVPRKGFDVLIAALAPLVGLKWQLTIAGDLTRDSATAAKLKADIARGKLDGRIDLLGAVQPEELPSLYSSADIFVLASHFEGYGMAYAEAMAHGLPIIGTTGGATKDTVPPQAGVLVDPGDVKALSRALKRLIESEEERRSFAAGALAASADLPAWPGSARIVATVLQGLA